MAFSVETDRRCQVIDVTDRVEDAVPDDADGVATVFVRHTSAGITINEAEPRLLDDVETALATLIPRDGPTTHHADDSRADGPSRTRWRHDDLDDNAAAHLRAMLFGASESIPVSDGSLVTGTWQSVLLVEGDGPRRRTIDVVVTD